MVKEVREAFSKHDPKGLFSQPKEFVKVGLQVQRTNMDRSGNERALYISGTEPREAVAENSECERGSNLQEGKHHGAPCVCYHKELRVCPQITAQPLEDFKQDPKRF